MNGFAFPQLTVCDIKINGKKVAVHGLYAARSLQGIFHQPPQTWEPLKIIEQNFKII